MDDKRERRFYQKLETLEDRLTFIEENFPEIDELIGNRVLRKALYKEFQELTEALGDLSAMMTKEEGTLMKDDYSNPERLKNPPQARCYRKPQASQWSQECADART